MSNRFGTESEIRQAVRDIPDEQDHKPVDTETFPAGYARIENPKTGEKRTLKKDHKERVPIYHFETKKMILRRPVDAWELMGLGQADFEKPKDEPADDSKPDGGDKNPKTKAK